MTGMQGYFSTHTVPVDEGQVFLFTAFPVHCLYYVEHFFRKKNNADTVPVLKKIYDEHKCGRCLATMFYFQLIHVRLGIPCKDIYNA